MSQRHGYAAVLFGITVALFLPTLISYPDAWRSPAYNHGYLIAVATVLLVWRERDHLRPGPPNEVQPAILLVGVGLSLIWLGASIASVRVVGQDVLPLLLLMWAIGVLGRDAGRRLIPLTAIFLLAVPVWEVLVPPLRFLTIQVSTFALGVLGVPAVIEGNVVEIRFGSFLIADGCAGLSYLLAGITIGALYAHVLATGWRSRAAVVALGAALAIVGNWIRVASLIVIGDATRMQSSLVEEHLTYGWAIFLVGLLLFFPLAGRLERWAGPGRGSTALSERPEGVSPGEAREAPPVPTPVRRGIMVSLAIACGPLIFYVVGALPAGEPPAPSLPGAPSQWRAVSPPPERPPGWFPAFAGASEHLEAFWTDGSDRVLFDRLVYRDQAQGAELIGHGNQIASDSVLVARRLVGPVGPRRRLVNEAMVRDGEAHLLVWYWYRVGGAETESAARAKLLEVWAFFKRSPTSELIGISTPCGTDSCAQASQTLARFLGST